MREKIVVQTVKYEGFRDQLSHYNQNILRKILDFTGWPLTLPGFSLTKFIA
jgi:hypothetical protein